MNWDLSILTSSIRLNGVLLSCVFGGFFRRNDVDVDDDEDRLRMKSAMRRSALFFLSLSLSKRIHPLLLTGCGCKIDTTVDIG